MSTFPVLLSPRPTALLTTVVVALCASACNEQPAAPIVTAPPQPVTPSPVTKPVPVVVSPLAAEGDPELPDSMTGTLRLFNEQQAEGVTAENNAAVLLAQVSGFEHLDDSLRSQFFEVLKVPQPVPDEFVLVTPQNFLAAPSPDDDVVSAVTAQELTHQLASLAARAWTDDEAPEAAAWIDANAIPLEIVKQATLRTRYYSPLLVPDDSPGMLSIQLPVEQSMRLAGWLLAARATRNLSEQTRDAASSDILACERLAELIGEVPFGIVLLVRVYIQHVAFRAHGTLIANRLAPASVVDEVLQRPQTRTTERLALEVIDRGERLMMLGELERIQQGESDTLASIALIDETLEPLGGIDWDLAREGANQIYDTFIQAMQVADPEQRRLAIDSESTSLRVVKDEIHDLVADVDETLAIDRDRTSRVIGRTAAALGMPDCALLQRGEDLIVCRERLLMIAYSMTRHHAEFGRYPPELTDALPSDAAGEPIDPLSGEPFQRRSHSGGALEIYSVGANGVDDGGPFVRSDSPNDDFGIWLP